jgi:hypothetical protein
LTDILKASGRQSIMEMKENEEMLAKERLAITSDYWRSAGT